MKALTTLILFCIISLNIYSQDLVKLSGKLALIEKPCATTPCPSDLSWSISYESEDIFLLENSILIPSTSNITYNGITYVEGDSITLYGISHTSTYGHSFEIETQPDLSIFKSDGCMADLEFNNDITVIPNIQEQNIRIITKEYDNCCSHVEEAYISISNDTIELHYITPYAIIICTCDCFYNYEITTSLPLSDSIYIKRGNTVKRFSLDEPTSIQEVESFNISPNPVENYIYISEEASSYKIYNNEGKLIKSGINVNQKINVQDLLTGFYILEVKNQKEILTAKFTKL